MRLVIDCFKLVKGAGKSIGIYNLALNLVRDLAANPQKNTLIVLGNTLNKKDFDMPGIRFIEIKNKNPLNKFTCILWELFEVSFYARRLRADRVLFPRGYAPMLHLTKASVIIHDMIPFYYHEQYPGYFNRLENFYIMWRLRASARGADDVITISEASKRDLIRYSKVPPEKITVIYNGHTAISCPEGEKVDRGYIVANTSALPHKNAVGIVKSYERYCQMTDQPLPLTIVGIERIDQFVSSCTVSDQITCIKYIESDEAFHKLIREARLFVFLPLIEGFGFPPIEAMELGTPVLCSDTSSLPEVVGNAAVCVNPKDYDKAAQAMLRMAADEELRTRLQERGYANVKRFSWNETGIKYRKVLFN
ncbi:MAG: glycosyltransferase family 4 protein [Lachnospiraceae bacterium]|nr:glycosyltransferase family 4 protein [Lachnospiraceae bacterium]